jgi:hypothetical protein
LLHSPYVSKREKLDFHKITIILIPMSATQNLFGFEQNSFEHRILVIALVSATLIKLCLALGTYGSADTTGFLDHLEKIRALGVGAYRVRGPFNNPFNSPPPMIHVINFWGWLADLSRLRFEFWLRLSSILADIGSFIIVASILRKIRPTRKSFGVLLALAVCPTAILVSGYHGNTDSVMIFLVILSVYLVDATKRNWVAGLIFGLALCVKIMPLCFGPAIFFYLIGWRRRLHFFGAAILTFVVLSMPYLAQDPKAIWATVFGYGSIYGRWGWTQLAVLTFPGRPVFRNGQFDVLGSHGLFAQILKVTTILLVVISSLWVNQRKHKPALFVQVGFITAIVLFMAPGFGAQYLVWLVPFVLVLQLRLSLQYYAVTTAYLVSTYICNASSACLPVIAGLTLSLVCWLSVLVCILGLARIFNQEIFRRQETRSTKSK